MTHEANWISVQLFGSKFEEEMDVAAKPPRFRHREIGAGVWIDGPKPREKMRQEDEDAEVLARRR